MSLSTEEYAAPPSSYISNISDATKREFFLRAQAAKREVDAAKKVHQKLSAVYRKVLKDAETEGVSKQAIIETLAIAGLGQDAVVKEEKAKLEMWTITNTIVGLGSLLFGSGEPNLPDPEATAELSEAAAFTYGHGAGMSGELRENNIFAPGSLEHVSWDRGWANGQAAIAIGLSPTPAVHVNGKGVPTPTPIPF